jgi:zinc/manganese transport system substrate-binding protein/manganese/iron transport system substrate-binding protein
VFTRTWKACVGIGLLALLALGMLAGCGGEDGSGNENGATISVVATTTQIADMTRNVARERAAVDGLLPANADAHDFEPTPRDVDKVAEADLVLVHGLHLDEWVENLARQSGTDAPILTVTNGVTTLAGSETDEQDPHVWFDVANAKIMVGNIRHALIQTDPDGKAQYEANASAYLAQLDELDGWIRSQIETIPPANRKLVTNHDAFGYYVRAYGLEFVGAIIPSLDTRSQPSAQETAALIDAIKAQGVKAIFTEASLNPELAEQIADEAGVIVVDNLYGDSLGAADSGAGTYIDMMRHNTTLIVEALR